MKNREIKLRIRDLSPGFEEYYCEITDKLDEYLLGGVRRFYRTYMCDYGDRKRFNGEEGYIYLIRVPGATRGCVMVNPEGVIDRMEIYEDSYAGRLNCYRSDVVNVTSEFMGCKILN